MNPLAGGIIPQHEKELAFLAGQDHTPTEAALRFCISCPQITVTLNGFTSIEHIDMACHAAEHAEPFTEAETLFLRSVVVRKYVGDPGYGGRVEEEWHGWYSDLVDYDVTPALIADLYTNPDPQMGPVGVLHTATGRPVVEVMLVGDGGQRTAYIGPSFTYMELLQSEGGLRRLDDQDWQTLCDPKSYLNPDSRGITLPHAPEWVTSFRVLSEDVQHLKLPARQELSPEERIKNDQAAPIREE